MHVCVIHRARHPVSLDSHSVLEDKRRLPVDRLEFVPQSDFYRLVLTMTIGIEACKASQMLARAKQHVTFRERTETRNDGKGLTLTQNPPNVLFPGQHLSNQIAVRPTGDLSTKIASWQRHIRTTIIAQESTLCCRCSHDPITIGDLEKCREPPDLCGIV